MANSCTIKCDNRVFNSFKDFKDYIQYDNPGYLEARIRKLLDENTQVNFNMLSELIKEKTGKDVTIQTTSSKITVQDFINAILDNPADRIRDTSNVDPAIVDSFKSKLEQNNDNVIITDLVLDDKLSTIDKNVVGKCDIITVNKVTGGTILYFFKEDSNLTDGEKLELAIYANLLGTHGFASRLINTYVVDNTGKETFVDISTYLRNQVVQNVQDVNIDQSPDVLDRATKSLNTIFPEHNIRATGRTQAAKIWCRRHANQFKKVFDPSTGNWNVLIPAYLLNFDDNLNPENVITVQIKDGKTNLRENKELINAVEQYFDNNNIIGKAYSKIKNGYIRGVGTVNVNVSAYLRQRFSKYFLKQRDGTYLWKMIENESLEKAHMFLFQNRITNQVDVVVLTDVPVGEKENFGVRKNLLGEYISNTNDYGFVMDNTYGNIEAIRAMAVLNECLKGYDNIKLGELSVLGISPHVSDALGVSHDFNDLTRQWDEVVKIVNKESSDSAYKIENNIAKHKIECTEPDALLDQLWGNINLNENAIGINDFFSSQHYGSQSYGLYDAPTVNDKIKKLYELINILTERLTGEGINPRSQNALISASQKANQIGAYAKLYIAAVKTLLKYTGDAEFDTSEISDLQSLFIKPASISNSSVRKVVEIVRQTHARGNIEINEIWNNVQHIFEAFNKAKGYGVTRNILLSDQYRLYENLYQKDANGNKTFEFKNPYEDGVDLDKDEKIFLKDILFEFYKIRCRLLNIEPTIKGPDDPRLTNKTSALPAGYLLVPLTRASTTTRRNRAIGRLGSGVMLKEKLERVSNALKMIFSKDRSEWKDLFSPGSSNDSLSAMSDELNVYNPYLSREDPSNSTTRYNYIEEKGQRFFETNVETIFSEFMSKTIICEKMNQSLIKINGIETILRTTLIFQGEQGRNKEKIDKIISTIDKYVNIVVRGQRSSGKGWERAEAFSRKMRPLLSKLFIAGNPSGFVRDMILGPIALSTFAAIGYHPNIKLKDVRFGFAHSWLQKLSNPMSRTFYSEMNKRYQLSRFGVSELPLNLVTARAGIANIDTLAFITMRAPDFINRMALLTAVLHNLGAYEAYSLDENNHIKYDWKKDKRFSIYASGDTSNPKYKEQQSAYYSAINQYNKDNDTDLGFDDDLPDALSSRQLYSIRTMGERLYGGYDKASKSLCEHHALMNMFALFYSWLNGIVELHFAGSHVSGDMWKTVQECDNNGNLLFIDPDTHEATTTDTGIRLLKEVPMMNEGVFTTIANGFREFIKDKRNFRDSFYGNSVARRNIKLFLSEIALTLLSALIHGLWLDKEYEEHMKTVDGRNLLGNALVEIMFKGSNHCFDALGGPFTLFKYLTTGISPLAAVYPKETLIDLWGVMKGHKDPVRYFYGLAAPTRSIKESLMYWERDANNYDFAKIRAQKLKEEKR